MAIFPTLEVESTLQVNDKTRLNALKTFISPDEAAISLVRIKPEATALFVDVTTNKYLDWSYATDGAKTVTVEVTTDGAPVTLNKTITVLSETDDKLFSVDSELTAHEPEILNYVRAGRSSFLDVHRLSQDRILTYLDEKRIWDSEGNRLTKDAVTDIEEVNDWSKFMTLMFIFEGLSNAVDDIFDQKAKKYRTSMEEARNRATLRLDLTDDSTINPSKIDMRSVRLVRR